MEYRIRERSRLVTLNPLQQWLYIYILISLLALYPLRAHDAGYDHIAKSLLFAGDLDLDNDGILNSVEDENLDGDDDPSTNPTDTDGDGIPNYLDIDSDDDGILDNVEAQPTVGYVPPSGVDANDNGLDDAYEGAFGFGIDPINSDQRNIPDYLDIDSDIDGIRDNIEGQSFVDYVPPSGVDANQNGLDDAYEGSYGFGIIPVSSDDDPFPDFRDFDSDGDGIKDKVEAQTTEDYIPPIGDSDGNDIDDAYEDGLDPVETDGDNIPDYRDIDTDNDGLLDNLESQEFDDYIAPSGIDSNDNGLDDSYEGSGINPINSDNDPKPDFRDIDSDNDGIPDNVEGQPTFGYVPPSGMDDDGDGLDNAYEGAGDEGISPQNTDSEDLPDYLDDDTDNDLVPDNNEGNDFNFDGIPDQMFTGIDTDGDGLDDGYEGSDVNDGFDVNNEIEDPANDLPDTDGTGDVNYRDIDDDGDGLDTPDEDADMDGDPTDDDNNGNGTPNYLDPTTAGLYAEDDEFTVSTGTSGLLPDINVLDNDTYLGDPVDPAIITLTSDPENGVTINPDGTITIEEGTPDGVIEIEYTICLIATSTVCDTATTTITIGASTGIDAVEDEFLVETGTSGTLPSLNVLDNDTLNGEPVDPADITLTSETTGGVTINPDGTVTIEEGTPDGVVVIEYTICENADPDNCDTTTTTITIGPLPVIDAVEDEFLVETGTSGTLPSFNVLDNDTLGGEPVDPADITLTSETTGGVTINPDGSVTIDEGTPDGVVVVEYTICQNNTSPANCDTTTTTITIGPLPEIDAVEDEFSVETGTSGTVPSFNVLDNDTLGGEPVDPADITLTSETTGGVTINPDGSITIDEGTPDGVVVVEYTICQNNTSPANCDTTIATITIGPVANPIDAVEDEFLVETGSSGTIPLLNVLDNDTLGEEPVDPAEVTLTSESTGGVTINPDGSITIEEGTPDGEVVLEYTICEIADPENCDTTTVTITIGPIPPIDAVDDFFIVESGTTGLIGDSNVLENDTLGGELVLPTDVVLTSEPVGGVTINPDGSISIAEGTPDGQVILEYTICQVTSPGNCDTAEVIVDIGPIVDPIDAVDDVFLAESGSSGIVPSINVLDNDTLNGEPVDPADVTLTSESTGGITINPDGSISIEEGTPDGEVILEYTICEIANPENCDAATVTITIGPIPPIDAVDDSFIVDSGTSGELEDINVLDNDTLGGEPVDPEDITLTSETTDVVTINPDGTITIVEGTPDGTVTLEYTICQNNTSPENCDTATVIITIGPITLIDAVDDDFGDNPVDGEIGGTVPNSNVLDNDTLDGLPVFLDQVTISSEPTGPLTVNPDGTVSVDAETASGTYTISYTICEIGRPDNCDTAFVTVEVFGPIEVNQLVTPNGDGKNDFLFIRNVDRTLTNTLRIYNRWGVAVYEGDNYNNQNNVFDGRSRASATISVDDFLPDGVYYYIFDYQTVNENTTDSGFIYISQ